MAIIMTVVCNECNDIYQNDIPHNATWKNEIAINMTTFIGMTFQIMLLRRMKFGRMTFHKMTISTKLCRMTCIKMSFALITFFITPISKMPEAILSIQSIAYVSFC